jgi:preprotein translocase subunit SecG
MVIFLTVIHVIVCVFLVIVVLLQSGKAADLAGAFGGMGSQTVFGPRGSATVLSKATTIAAAVFMCTSLTLSIMAQRQGHGGPSLLDKAAKPVPAQTQPAQGQPAQPSVPITVTPSTNGVPGQSKPVQVPVSPTPNPNQKK